MKQNLFEVLYALLRKESRFCSEDGHLLKNAIVEAALVMDELLLSYLIKEDSLRGHFFKEISGALVFDKVAFQRFVMNKAFLPDSYTMFKNKIGLTNENGEFICDSREVVLSWPYKDCFLEGGQTKEDAKRDEIFWNEILAPDEITRLTEPKAFANFLKFDKSGSHKIDQFSHLDNLIIKGNNLLSLYSLRKLYAGKVKLIYIDPPYNTGSDSFGYNDSFKHSTWLTFIKNRLEVAKEFLRKDGVFAIHCDDNEQAYLKVLCDSIFGESNFITCVVNQSASSVFGTKASAKNRTLIKVKDYILFYKQDQFTELQPLYYPSSTYIYDTHADFVFDGVERKSTVQWFKDNYGQDFEKIGLKVNKDNINIFLQMFPAKRKSIVEKLSLIQFTSTAIDIAVTEEQDLLLRQGQIIDFNGSYYMRENDGKGKIRILRPLKESCRIVDGELRKVDLLGDVWNFSEHYGNISTEGGVRMPNGKKPEYLMYSIISAFTKEGDLIMDFHLGSGTTVAVAHKMNRRYIGCEQIDSQMELTLTRLKNVIAGDSSGISKTVGWAPQDPSLLDGNKYLRNSFVYCELACANQKFISDIESACTRNDLLSIWESIQHTGFLSYKIDIHLIDKKATAIDDLSFDDLKKFIIESLDKNLLYVPYSDLNDLDYSMSPEDKELTIQFYTGK